MNCGGTGPETCVTLIAPEGGKSLCCSYIVCKHSWCVCTSYYLTYELAPTTARNLTAIPGRNNVTLMWTSPLQPNGNVSYIYTISETTSGAFVTSGITTTLNTFIENLRTFTNYMFTVTAVTSAGSSVPVMETFMTLEGCTLYLYSTVALCVFVC